MPTNWATTDLDNIDFQKIRYYLSDGQAPKRSWDDVPPEVLETFERLGVPQSERAFLAGVEAQYDSEAAYSNMKEGLEKEGVIFRKLQGRSQRIRGDFPPLVRQSDSDWR